MIERTFDTYIRTSTGRKAWPLNPQPDDICIEDIASALSKLCRFNGHTRSFYSVAQHSVIVSHAVPGQFALCGLLHDASEAYLCDIPTPIKGHFPGYHELEDRLMQVIATQFGFAWPMPPDVKRADTRALVTEQRDLMLGSDRSYPIMPFVMPIEPLDPEAARKAFIARYREIMDL